MSVIKKTQKRLFKRAISASVSSILLFFSIFSITNVHANRDSINQVISSTDNLEEKLVIIDSLITVNIYADTDELGYFAYLYDSIANLIGTDYYLVRALTNTGMYHYVSEEYDKSTTFYLQALEMIEKDSDNIDERDLGNIYNNLATSYRFSDDFDNTIKYYNKSLAIYNQLKDTMWIANLNNNLSIIYMEHEYFDLAEQCFENAISGFKILKNDLFTGIAYLNYGNLSNMIGEYKNAIAHYDSSMILIPQEQIPLAYASAYNGIGTAQTKLKQYDLALPNFKKSIKISEEISHSGQLSEAYSALANYYDNVGDYKSAYATIQKVYEIKDSMKIIEQDQNIADALTKYDSEKKDQQIELLNAENQLKQLTIQKVKRQRVFSTIGLLGLLILATLLFRLFRLRQQANNLLEEKNIAIQKALGQKEILLKEIHHRVKNNLQVISSLLSLQSRRIEDPKALEAIQEGSNRVKSMALIHQNLYQHEDLVGVDLENYIQKLTKSLVNNYKVSDKDIEIKTDVDPIKLDIDTIIPIGLILNELVSNALKYAFKDKASGSIEVVCKEEGNHLLLNVKDNGIGLPENFDIKKLKSLGFKLIKSFSDKLGAEFSLKGEDGTTVEMRIRKYEIIK